MIALALFLGFGFLGWGAEAEVVGSGGAGIEAGCGLFWREGGGERRDDRDGGGRMVGAIGEEERVIVSVPVSLRGTGFVFGWFRVCVSGFAVGGGVVGLFCCAGWMRRMEPPSVSEGRELGSGLGDGRAAGEVDSAGGVGSECWEDENSKNGRRVGGPVCGARSPESCSWCLGLGDGCHCCPLPTTSISASKPMSISGLSSKGINNGLDVCTGALKLFINGPRSRRVLRRFVTVPGSGGRISSASSNRDGRGVGLGSRGTSCIGDDERRSTISIADLSFAALFTSPPCD